MKSASKITINTGNVLNLIDIKKKAGQNVADELSESIKLTLSEWNSQKGQQNGHASDITSKQDYLFVSTSEDDKAQAVNISRLHDDIELKMAEEGRKNLKIGVKIFINEDSTSSLTECLEHVFCALHTDHIDNVILAYNPQDLNGGNDFKSSTILDLNDLTNEAVKLSSHTSNDVGKFSEEDELEAKNSELVLPGIKVLWAVLENYVQTDRVRQLGIADVSGVCLRKLHAWCKIRPTIAQINLASCCVVPPSIHDFCRANDIQLLTHADPPDLLSVVASKTLKESDIGTDTLDWCARYQVHIKCRGVLALKGYVCKASAHLTK